MPELSRALFDCMRENGIAQTRKIDPDENCRNSTCSAEDFLARLPSVARTQKDLEIPEEPCLWSLWLTRKPRYLLFEKAISGLLP